jgi:hypothetical protein
VNNAVSTEDKPIEDVDDADLDSGDPVRYLWLALHGPMVATPLFNEWREMGDGEQDVGAQVKCLQHFAPGTSTRIILSRPGKIPHRRALHQAFGDTSGSRRFHALSGYGPRGKMER